MVEETRTVYVVYDHKGGAKIYHSKNSALYELAQNMIREKKVPPAQWDRDGWDYIGRLHERLVRYLKFTMKEEG